MTCRHHDGHRPRHHTLCSRGRGLPLPLPVLLVAAAGLAAAAPLPAWAAEDPAAILREIDAAALEPARAVTLKGVRLAAGLASIQLEGTLLPATPVAGRSRGRAVPAPGQATPEPPRDT